MMKMDQSHSTIGGYGRQMSGEHLIHQEKTLAPPEQAIPIFHFIRTVKNRQMEKVSIGMDMQGEELRHLQHMFLTT